MLRKSLLRQPCYICKVLNMSESVQSPDLRPSTHNHHLDGEFPHQSQAHPPFRPVQLPFRKVILGMEEGLPLLLQLLRFPEVLCILRYLQV